MDRWNLWQQADVSLSLSKELVTIANSCFISVPLLFFILFTWVFEIQLLMQIIINRIAVIAESPKTIRQLKYGTAIFITLINIAVFCIFIPAHLEPPVSQL